MGASEGLEPNLLSGGDRGRIGGFFFQKFVAK
jgi:hypothetical protein